MMLTTMLSWTISQWVLFTLIWLVIAGVALFVFFVIVGVPEQIRGMYQVDDDDEKDDDSNPFDDATYPTHAEYNAQVIGSRSISHDADGYQPPTSGYLLLKPRSLSEVQGLRLAKLRR